MSRLHAGDCGLNEDDESEAWIRETVTCISPIDGQIYAQRVPHRVVLVVSPWSYLYMTAVNTIAPALMAGNSVVLKHAAQTLLVGERLVLAFVATGVPSDVFQNVFLTHNVTRSLISNRAFDFVNVTGSVGRGRLWNGLPLARLQGVELSLGVKIQGRVGAYP